MTDRRTFFRNTLMGAVATAAGSSLSLAATATAGTGKWKHWVWSRPNKDDDEAKLKKAYKQYFEAGVRGIFFEADSEKHFRAAKLQGLEAHRWIWTLNRGEKSLLQAHPEWYSYNRKGESCATHPPYVGYYRWLCPSREEVAQYLEEDVNQQLRKDYVDGIHLDYVRYCDVVLPVNLWDTYKIEQTRELPEYDYCYCPVCKEKFKAWKQQSLDDIVYPEASLSWRLYRCNAVTNIVNRLAKVAQSHRKPITAAVFPTPEVAKRNVRQDWLQWNLSGICPMIYHGFYKENTGWIGDAVHEGVSALHGKFPLYAGLYLPDFKNNTELHHGITVALQNGAAGISLFGNITGEVLNTLTTASANIKAAQKK